MTDQKEASINSYILAFEKMRDRIHFPVKTPKDNLQCPICGGHMKRRDKSKHSKGKKHRQMLPLILSGKVMPYIEWVEYDAIEESESESISDSESFSPKTKANTKKNAGSKNIKKELGKLRKSDSGSSDSDYSSNSDSDSYDN
jgi:hypothetical protein